MRESGIIEISLKMISFSLIVTFSKLVYTVHKTSWLLRTWQQFHDYPLVNFVSNALLYQTGNS